jgi:hypothetical protein
VQRCAALLVLEVVSGDAAGVLLLLLPLYICVLLAMLQLLL